MSSQSLTDHDEPSPAGFKKTYRSVFFGFLDILGFGDIVRSTEHNRLEHLYLTLPAQLDGALAGERYVAVGGNARTLRFLPDIDKATVNSLLVSDSIMLWTNTESMRAFFNILTAVRDLMISALVHGMPLRGAISRGPLTLLTGRSSTKRLIFQHTLFGKPIVEAANAEKVQEWSGCIITPTAMEPYLARNSRPLSSVPPPARSDETALMCIFKRLLLRRYPVPIKTAEGRIVTDEQYVVNWAYGGLNSVYVDEVTEAFTMHGKSVVDPRIKSKMENTIKFVRHVNPKADRASYKESR